MNDQASNIELAGWTAVWHDGQLARFERQVQGGHITVTANATNRWDWDLWYHVEERIGYTVRTRNERVAYERFGYESPQEAAQRAEFVARRNHML